MRRFSLVFLLLAATASRAGAPAPELDAVEKTRALLQQKLDEHDTDLRARVRALYKLSAGGTLPLWVEPGAREDILRRRGVARRVILRDLEERAELRNELARVLADEQRLVGQEDGDPPAPRSLLSPGGQIVNGFGLYQDEATHARLWRSGVELAARGPTPSLPPRGPSSTPGPSAASATASSSIMGRSRR
jgi:hypothetical protein